MPVPESTTPPPEGFMASAFAKTHASAAHGFTPQNQAAIPPVVNEMKSSELRLNQAFSLLEYKVQQLIARQHHELTQLHLRLQETQAMGDEITDDMFFQADIAKEKAAIQAELDAVNAREYEIRVMAHTLLKSLEQGIRKIEVKI